MKKLFVIYFSLFLLTYQVCTTQTDCPACYDKNLIQFKAKDSLSIEEKKIYAVLQQNCEICMASKQQIAAIKEQTKAIKEQTRVIDDKPSAAAPLWFVVVFSVIIGFFTYNISKK